MNTSEKRLFALMLLLGVVLVIDLGTNQINIPLLLETAQHDPHRDGFIVKTYVDPWNPWELRGREIFVPMSALSEIDAQKLKSGEYFEPKGGVVAFIKIPGSLWLLTPLRALSFEIDPGWDNKEDSPHRSDPNVQGAVLV